MATDVHIIAGVHPVRIALMHDATTIQKLWYVKERQDSRVMLQVAKAVGLRLPTHEVERATLDQITNGAKHQGIAAQVTTPKMLTESVLNGIVAEATEPALLLVLDGLQDPHNLGACLRTADAAGAQAVIAPKDRSVGLTTAVCKVASGAVGHIPYVQVTNLARTLSYLHSLDLYVVGTAADAHSSLYQIDFCRPVVIVMGGEGKGLRRLTREHCDLLVHLPMQGVVESLNVAVATGVMLYEARRQRSIKVLR